MNITKSIVSRIEYLLSLPANTEEETDELQALIDLEVEFYIENNPLPDAQVKHKRGKSVNG